MSDADDPIDHCFEPPAAPSATGYVRKTSRPTLGASHKELRKARDIEWTRLIDAGETPEAVGRRFGYAAGTVVIVVRAHRVRFKIPKPEKPNRVDEIMGTISPSSPRPTGGPRTYKGPEPTEEEIELMRGWYYVEMMNGGLTVDDLARLGKVSRQCIYNRIEAYRETVRVAAARLRDRDDD